MATTTTVRDSRQVMTSGHVTADVIAAGHVWLAEQGGMQANPTLWGTHTCRGGHRHFISSQCSPEAKEGAYIVTLTKKHLKKRIITFK